MRSVCTDQGTAMPEATLCEQHYPNPTFKEQAERAAEYAPDCRHHRDWYQSDENTEVACIICGSQV